MVAITVELTVAIVDACGIVVLDDGVPVVVGGAVGVVAFGGGPIVDGGALSSLDSGGGPIVEDGDASIVVLASVVVDGVGVVDDVGDPPVPSRNNGSAPICAYVAVALPIRSTAP